MAWELREEIDVVPLLRRRSILILAIGLILGIAVGTGYWLASPINARLNMGWPPIVSKPVLHETVTTLGLVTSDDASLSSDRLKTEVDQCMTILNSFPFLNFLSKQLAEQAPQYAEKTEDLDKIITATYLTQGQGRPKIQLKVTSKDAQEAVYIANFVPQAFQQYLYHQYSSVVQEMTTLKEKILQDRRELGNITQQLADKDVNNNPAYITAKAEADALEVGLGNATRSLALLTGDSSSTVIYSQTLQKIDSLSKALAAARYQVAVLQSQSDTEQLDLKLRYEVTSNEVDSLEKQLSELSSMLGALPVTGEDGQASLSLVSLGKPSTPLDVPSAVESNTSNKVSARLSLGVGALLGLGIAFVWLNRKWVAKQLGASSTSEDYEDSEDSD
jgi:uncharacterized protein YneF (UPF0154 family)